MLSMEPYLKFAASKGASDLYFSAGCYLMAKVQGDVFPVRGEGMEKFTAEQMEQLANSIMTDGHREFFKENLEVDMALFMEGAGRFRVNIFRQRGNVSMVLRFVSEIPHIEDLGLPDVLKDLILNKRGLILMVGATGSGKSTTLAAMLRHRNENQTGHILTIEDPIEFYHTNIKSIVNQREVGSDTLSYHNALRSAVREAPDVILIGESRDRETMEASLTLAGTGHLAITTLHANNAYQALQRVVNLFPEDMREQLFMDLSINLRAIISQRLVKGKDGKRCAAVEVMINTPFIAELILKGRIEEVKEAMADSSQAGMQTFDDALIQLYHDERIDLDQALDNADSRANLETKLNFGG